MGAGHGRRAVLAMAAAVALLGSGQGAPAAPQAVLPEERMVRLDPMELPGKDRFSHVRLEAALMIRESKKLPEEVDFVRKMKPRIVGRLLDSFSADRITSTSLSAAEVQELKERIFGIVQAACGQPYVEEVVIISLILT
jgi:hypothetical protein